MGLVETEAIVLRTYKLLEADKIAVCLTEKAGVIRGVAKGARRLKSRFGASLEPFTVINLSYFEKEGRELMSFRHADIRLSSFALFSDAEAFRILEFLSELVIEFAPPHEPNGRLFRMVRACVTAISEDAEQLRLIVYYFELWVLKLSGFLPGFRQCANCRTDLLSNNDPVYLGGQGSLLCALCARRSDLSLAPMAYSKLLSMQQLPPGRWAQSSNDLALEVRQEMAHFLNVLIERALERSPRGRGGLPQV